MTQNWMCFLCGWTGGMCKKRGKYHKHPLSVTFSLLRIFRFFTCTENKVPFVINIGSNITDLLTSLFYLSHISWDFRLMDLNIYLKCTNFQPSLWIILISELTQINQHRCPATTSGNSESFGLEYGPYINISLKSYQVVLMYRLGREA